MANGIHVVSRCIGLNAWGKLCTKRRKQQGAGLGQICGISHEKVRFNWIEMAEDSSPSFSGNKKGEK